MQLVIIRNLRIVDKLVQLCKYFVGFLGDKQKKKIPSCIVSLVIKKRKEKKRESEKKN